MAKVELDSDLRQAIIAEAEEYALRPPGPNEVTVRMLEEETSMTKRQAREFLDEKVKAGEYYLRQNGLNPEGKSSCYVYGKEQDN